MDIFGIKQGVYDDQGEFNKHISSLSTLPDSKEQEHLFNHLYECLSILDNKSSSLLQFNSIISAVFAIFINSNIDVTPVLYVSSLGMSLLLVSCCLLLLVIRVHWSDTEEMQDLESHGKALLEVRGYRTVRYRLAWYLSMVSVFFLFASTCLRLVA